MAIKISQSLKQQQSLMMTPQLQQAIKLLTLTHLEMTNVIAEEMVENPMLEELGVDDSGEKNSDDYREERLEFETAEATAENFDDKPIMAKENDDFDWSTYAESFNTSSSSPPSMVGPASSDEMPNYENIVSRGQTLTEHLEWQLHMEELSENEFSFAMHIIHSINDDGYLSLPFEELISEADYDREAAFDLLNIVQRLDPVGCAAENLTDCLLAQARIMEERSPLLEKIIRKFLPDLQCKDYPKISKETGVSVETIKATAEILKNFHPKPGRLISSQETHYVVPDIYVQEIGGEFSVVVNEDGVPKLRVSKLYQQMLDDKSKGNKEAQDYVQEKLRSAIWLIKSIQNRQRTIVKVSKAIVRQQQDFFKLGPKYLKPMILKNIAEEIGMHESTVSRVTTNKYMHTPIGLFELKYFFNSGIGGSNGGGNEISSEVLKLKIKEMIDNENPKKPLSDQKIADLLSRDELKVARRTVAKYREMLNIFSSAKRKLKE